MSFAEGLVFVQNRVAAGILYLLEVVLSDGVASGPTAAGLLEGGSAGAPD